MIRDVSINSSPSIWVTRARLSLAFLTFVHTILATWIVGISITASGWTLPAAITILLFASLFGLVAFSFWMASIGMIRRLYLQATDVSNSRDAEVRPNVTELKTAILVPVFNESPMDVLASVIAMRRSLLERNESTRFEFFILSDTTDPAIWKEEERLWAESIESDNTTIPIFYRRRSENIGRKSGNLEDFCVRWGSQYEFMIVLDADSLMDAATMQAMVDRMQAKPHLGMLQVPPVPINRLTLFARLQQFAASVYGPTFTEGLQTWAGSQSNYWGHNAIIRVAPFMQHCGLPILPGKAPLGGEILSHDFVEAALMLRANWGVELASDLGGSYEECPTNLLDFAIRDQRWCQGNLQHARLVFSDGFHPISRFHMAMGVLSYMASPLWLVFIILSIWSLQSDLFSIESTVADGWFVQNGVAFVFGMTMSMLLIPKLWGWIVTVSNRDGRRRQGGAFRLLVSVLIESILSCMMAPAMMVFHSRFVLNTLRGRRITWSRQNRDECQLGWKTAWKNFGLLTSVGVVLSGVILYSNMTILWWLLPVSLGWASTMPLALVGSQISIGCLLQRWRLLLIPEETDPPRVLQYKLQAHALLEKIKEPKPTAQSKLVSPHFLQNSTTSRAAMH